MTLYAMLKSGVSSSTSKGSVNNVVRKDQSCVGREECFKMQLIRSTSQLGWHKVKSSNHFLRSFASTRCHSKRVKIDAQVPWDNIMIRHSHLT
ncbi:hypothetical protein PsorP6_001473 [Peronosclerospora sorghi]|uniref:Uncharacterized protein n=1 Tax=Peronosclerospora sorghi TaxID=230839 RepID=A0ACC0WVA3_9STRA|nr:hypothetical protein PsorP6_001473 [Peronosclerospora sorghi]